LALDKLEEAELVFRRGEPPDYVYSFKHALIRDTAYESLLKTRRKQLHGQIALSLQANFPEIGASQPEIVARHFTEAGIDEPAVNYWLKAGNLALPSAIWNRDFDSSAALRTSASATKLSCCSGFLWAMPYARRRAGAPKR
jgi:hypothetical protein